MEYVLFILYPLALVRVRLIMPALAVHGALIAASAIRYGRVPLIGPHDTLGFLAWSIGLVYLLFGWKRGRDASTVWTVPLLLLLLAGSLSTPAVRGPLPPVLRTIWFELHVVLSFVSYAL